MAFGVFRLGDIYIYIFTAIRLLLCASEIMSSLFFREVHIVATREWPQLGIENGSIVL